MIDSCWSRDGGNDVDHLVGTVEYTDCIFAEGLDECPGYNTR